MNDAWNVIGWTVQKPPVIFPDNVNPPWQIPADIDTVLVAGEFHSIDGGMPSGYVQFAPTEQLTHAATGASMMQPTFVARIGMDGRFSLRLPATNSLGIVAAYWAYDVEVVLLHKVVHRFTTALPLENPVVGLDELLQVATDIPEDTLLLDGGTA